MKEMKRMISKLAVVAIVAIATTFVVSIVLFRFDYPSGGDDANASKLALSSSSPTKKLSTTKTALSSQKNSAPLAPNVVSDNAGSRYVTCEKCSWSGWIQNEFGNPAGDGDANAIFLCPRCERKIAESVVDDDENVYGFVLPRSSSEKNPKNPTTFTTKPNPSPTPPKAGAAAVAFPIPSSTSDTALENAVDHCLLCDANEVEEVEVVKECEKYLFPRCSVCGRYVKKKEKKKHEIKEDRG